RIQERDLNLPAQSSRALEPVESLAELSFNAIDIAKAQIGPGEAERMVVQPFGHPERVVRLCAGLVELTALSEGARQALPGLHSGKEEEAKPLPGPLAIERLDLPPTDVFGRAIVARDVARVDQVVLGGGLEQNIAERLANGLGPLRQRAHLGGVGAR